MIISKINLQKIATDAILKEYPTISVSEFAKKYNAKIKKYNYILENL